MDLRPLLLAGGQSSRMGCPKHLLQLHDGTPVYVHLLRQLQGACPDADELYISLRESAQHAHMIIPEGLPLNILYDIKSKDSSSDLPSDIGPAGGLLAAYRANPTAHWLILACDYPLITTADLAYLRDMYKAPVTCYENAEGWSEPLVGMWSPEALKRLEENVQQGITGPKHVVRSIKGKTVRVKDERALYNTNTREEWDKAMRIARHIDVMTNEEGMR